jgi:hypothetical protein
VVTYRFDPTVDAPNRQAVVAALSVWAGGPGGVRFQEVQGTLLTPLAWAWGLDRAVLVRVDKNLATFGRTTLGAGIRRELVFNPDLTTQEWRETDLVHEWGHVLGLTHEHQRRDRDLYVAFPRGFLEGLSPDRRPDYAPDPGDPPANADRPYDFDSIMHYSSNVDGNRMVRRDNGALIPGARTPSPGDWSRLVALYDRNKESP